MCALLAAVSTLAVAQVATITTRADDVDVSWDERTISLRGNAELEAHLVVAPSQFVRITAEVIEGDLTTGHFEAVGNVLLVTELASVRGESLVYDANTSEYRLKRASIVVQIGDEPDGQVCGFAYGREIYNDGDLIHVIRGSVTTCERLAPDYSVAGKRLTFNTRRGSLRIDGGKVRLYGASLPLPPGLTYTFLEGDGGRFQLMPRVRYNRRDLLHLNWALPLNIPKHQIKGRGYVKLTPFRGIRARTDIQAPAGPLTAHIRAGLRQDVRADVDEWAFLDPRPEVALEQAWDTDLFGGAELSMEVAAGAYKEHGVRNDPPTYDRRLMGWARLAHNYDQWETDRGTWWWLGASQAWYDSGTDYTVLEAGVGAGTKMTDWLSGSLTYSYHHTHGATPFESDEIDIEQELAGRLRFDFDENWSLRTTARYDVQQAALRDYELELARRVHCLTWFLRYRDRSGSLSLGVAINGLMQDEPGHQQHRVTDGPPDYWRWREDRQQADGPGEQTDQTTETTE